MPKHAAAAYSPRQASSETATRTLTLPGSFLHRPCVYTASLKQNPDTSTIPNTPLTAIQHSLLQRNETCGTRLLVSPVHWLSA